MAFGTTKYSSVEEIDVDIRAYQKHVNDLTKVIKSGTSKSAAVVKLAEAEKQLAVLTKKRERYSKAGAFEGWSGLGSCGPNCECGRKSGGAGCSCTSLSGLGGFDGAVGSLIGNVGIVAIILVSLTAWIIQQDKGGAARDDGLQWYDIAALPTHAVMIPLSYVAEIVGP